MDHLVDDEIDELGAFGAISKDLVDNMGILG